MILRTATEPSAAHTFMHIRACFHGYVRMYSEYCESVHDLDIDVALDKSAHIPCTREVCACQRIKHYCDCVSENKNQRITL